MTTSGKVLAPCWINSLRRASGVFVVSMMALAACFLLSFISAADKCGRVMFLSGFRGARSGPALGRGRPRPGGGGRRGCWPFAGAAGGRGFMAASEGEE